MRRLLYWLCLLTLLTALPARAEDIEARVNDLLGRMTLEEKVGQLVQVSAHEVRKDGAYLERVRHGGIGSFLNLAFNADVDKAGRYSQGVDQQALTIGATRCNKYQRVAMQEARLHIPLLMAQDVIHGFRTTFPVPLAEASSFDAALAERDARLAAEECSAVGIRWTFAPMVDIARDPRWGRIVEGSGEDPYLGSRMAEARVRGFQGTAGSPTSVMATAKHYVAYGGAEGGRDYNTVDISERTLREVYLPPFQAAARAGVGSFMVAFNEIGGVPSSSNAFTARDVLRHEWGWNGIIVSDWNSIGELQAHGVAVDLAQATMLGMQATVDVDMVADAYYGYLPELVREGRVSEQLLDDSVRRVLRAKFQLGLFEHPYLDPRTAEKAQLTPAHLAAAREAGRESVVLLKNDGGLLPLRKNVRSIAVIGPLADDAQAQLGSWTGAGRPADAVTLLSGIRQHVSPQTRVLYTAGCSLRGGGTSAFSRALSAARFADVVVMAVGEAGDMSGEAHSRARLDLPGEQQRLVEAVAATGKPLVVVLMNGRPLAIPWIAQHVPAIVEGWFLGSQAGPALADVLFGDYNPSGKLPCTFPREVGQVPIYYNHKNSGRPAISKYEDIPNSPLFPFGYGLSYTRFQYSNLRLSGGGRMPKHSQPRDQAGVRVVGDVTAMVDVTNVGKRTGTDVVQLYIHRPVASVTQPVLALKGFQRISLKPGATQTVRFHLGSEELSLWDDHMRFVVEPGTVAVMVGPDSTHLLRQHIRI